MCMTQNFRGLDAPAAIKQWIRSVIPAANKARLAFLVLLVGLACCSVFAATTGSISGTVKDAQGAVIQAATVQLRNEGTGVVLTVQTDSSGFYNFPSIAIGIYDVSFEKSGFEKFEQTKVVIDVDTDQRVDAELKVGSASEQITVVSTEAQVNTENAQIGEVLTATEMAELPNGSRAFTDLLMLQPGTVNVSVSQYSSITPNNSQNNGLLSIGGAQDVHSGFMVNGANTVDGLGEGTYLLPVYDSIAEMRVVTNNSGAEYGGFAGAISNVVTKSGTNQFHGDAFDYLSETYLDAADYFSQTIAPSNQTIIGGTVGGPVLRNKLFFFTDFQRTRSSGNYPVYTSAPSAAEKNGDLSAPTQEANLTGSVSSAYMAQLLNTRLSLPAGTITSGEPYYTSSCTQNSQCVFPGAQIPTKAWDPVSGIVLNKYFPTANTTLSNNGLPGFQGPAAESTNADTKGGFRGDVTTRFGAVSGYYHYDPWSQFSPPSFGTTVPGFPTINAGKAQLWVASLRTTFGSTAVNAFTASYTRNANVQGESSSGGQDLASFGFNTNTATGGIDQLAPAQYQNLPVISISQIGGVGASQSVIAQFNNTYGFADDFTKIVGTHSLQFGAQYHWDQIWVGHPLNASNGNFGFQGTETGDGLADYLIGTPSSFAQGSPVEFSLRNFYAGIYAEDGWRVSKGLTVNYGVRWEVDPFWKEALDRDPVSAPGVQSVKFPTAPLGYVFPGDPGIPQHLSFINWHDFGPRLSVAYSPDFSNGLLHTIFGSQGKSSIRAGYGIHYTNIEGYNDYNLGSPPYSLYYPSPYKVLFSNPFINRESGQQVTEPFPLLTGTNASTFNFSTYLPFAPKRSPLLHSPSPYEEHLDLSFQRALTSKTMLELTYDGSFGHHLTLNEDQNPASPALCQSLSQPSDVAPGSPTCGPGGSEGTYTRANGEVVHTTRVGALGSNFQGMGLEANVGNSAYNALFATLGYTANRLNFKVRYILSKGMDNGSGRGDQEFYGGNPNFFRCISDYDSRHNFTANYTYELPFDKVLHFNERITRGWKISGVTQFEQGIPVIVYEYNDDNSEVGDKGVTPWYQSTDEPVYTPGNIVGDHNPRHAVQQGTAYAYFNTSLFQPEAPGQQGNSPRRFFHSPGIDDTDVALIKAVKITEHTSAEFRAQFFNSLNHAQFSQGIGNGIDGNIDDGVGGFGTYSGGSDPRSGQFAVKFTF